MCKLVLLTIFAVISCAWAYSAGAPESTCEDMTPKHPVDPQKSRFPYKVSVNKDKVKPLDDVEITIAGKVFKGFLLQVREGDKKAVGEFQISDNDKYSKATNCSGGKRNAATHKNATEKKDFKLIWKAPATPGEYTVYATVAQDGGVFWVKQPTTVITVV